jgi:hypothetical protein
MTRASKTIFTGKDFIILMPNFDIMVQVKDEKREKRTFRKPPSLLHLTWKWKFWKFVFMNALALYRIYCYMEH